MKIKVVDKSGVLIADGTPDNCATQIIAAGKWNGGKVRLANLLRASTKNQIQPFRELTIIYGHDLLPVVGYNMGKPMSFRETPWWDATIEPISSGAENEPFVRNVRLREAIYDNSLGIQPAIYKRFYEEKAKLFPMPRTTVCAETKTMRVHDGVNAWDTTLQDFMCEKKLILNKYVLSALLGGKYKNYTIEWNPDYWNKINFYAQMFEETTNDPNREIQ